MTKNKTNTSKRGSRNDQQKKCWTSQKRKSAKGSEMESLKYAQDFPKIHLRVLRKIALRKCPKMHMPTRVHRDVPKHPQIENTTISLYCQQKTLEKRPKKGRPSRPFGGPLGSFGGPWAPKFRRWRFGAPLEALGAPKAPKFTKHMSGRGGVARLRLVSLSKRETCLLQPLCFYFLSFCLRARFPLRERRDSSARAQTMFF